MSACTNAITGARESQGLTIPQAAEAAGIDTTTWWRVETGETRNPSHSTVRAIARALGVATDDLFHDGDATAASATLREVPGSPGGLEGSPARREGSGRKSRSSKTQPVRSLASQRVGSERVE